MKHVPAIALALMVAAMPAKAEPITAVFAVAAIITTAVGGTVIYDEFTPKSQHCFVPSHGQRVCKIVKDADLPERIAEADALISAGIQRAFADGQIVRRLP